MNLLILVAALIGGMDEKSLLPKFPVKTNITWHLSTNPVAPKHINIVWDWTPTNGPVYFEIIMSTNDIKGPFKHYTNWWSSPIEVPSTFQSALFKVGAFRHDPSIKIP